METPPSNRGAFIAKLGAWLQLTLIAGLVIGLQRVRSEVEKGDDAAAQFSEAFGDLLDYVSVTFWMSCIGVWLVTLAVTLCHYRAKWLFSFLCYFGLLSIGISFCAWLFWRFWFPGHVAFGVFFLVFAIKKKREFVLAAVAARKLPPCYKLDP